MNEKIKTFAKYEKEEKLFYRKYMGVAYWQSIRSAFSRTIWGIKPQLESQKFSVKMLSGLNICTDLLRDIFRYISIPKCDVLYFDACSYRTINGVEVDSYFDYFNFDKKYKVYRCFHIYSRQKKTSLEGIGTVIPRGVTWLLMSFSKICRNFYQDRQEDIFLGQLAKKLKNNLHIKFSSKQLIQMVKREVITHKVYGKFYERLILKCEPKAIFLICHYNDYLFPLYNIAKKYSIPVIEIQHGAIANHDIYWYEDTSSIGKELPDYIFTYGNFWNERISLPDCMKVVPIGNPFLEAQKARYKKRTPDENMMVFYLSAPANKEMERLVIDAWNYFGKKGYKIFCKIHPLEYDHWKDNYKLLSSYPQIQIVKPDQDLYELLSCAKHHITYNSTVLYEATAFPNNRYVYDLGILSDGMEPLVELKMAYKFKTMEELANLLHISMGTGSDDEFEVWKMNADKNALAKLKEIIHEK